MKIPFFLLMLMTSPAFASTCPNFTGTFADLQDRDVHHRQWVWAQTGCEKITISGRWFHGDGSWTTREPATWETDGVLRQSCEYCYPSQYTMTETSLSSLWVGVTGRCNERHVFTLTPAGDIQDDWAFECPAKTYRFRNTLFRVLNP